MTPQRNLFCYPVPSKPRSLAILVAFAKGSGAQIVVDGKFRGGVSVFAGITLGMQRLWKDSQAGGYIYLDNSYFDKSRTLNVQRITWNALQHDGLGESTGARFKKLGIQLEPWRKAAGDYMLLCPQSDTFMQFPVVYPGDWISETRHRLSVLTKRTTMLREWSASKRTLAATLPLALRYAHATVAWTSAALVESVVHGVPIIAEGQCAASPMSGTWEQLENLPRPDRLPWAHVLADNQWTIEEMETGKAWRDLVKKVPDEARTRLELA